MIRTILRVCTLGTAILAVTAGFWKKSNAVETRLNRDVAQPTAGEGSTDRADDAGAIAAVEKLGGTLTRDDKIPGQPVTGVDLGGTAATDADLSRLRGLRHLQSLELRKTKVTDAGMENLKGLGNLQTLSVECIEVTGAGIEKLKGLTKLRSLTLPEGTTDRGLECIDGLTELQTLYIAGTKVTDAGLTHLERLAKLQTLGLANTRVTDVGLEHLAKSANLEYLDLMMTRITDAGPARLKGLPHLQTLIIPSTSLTDAGLAQVAELTGLRSLCVGSTKVTGGARCQDGPDLRDRRQGHGSYRFPRHPARNIELPPAQDRHAPARRAILGDQPLEHRFSGQRSAAVEEGDRRSIAIAASTIIYW